MDFVLLPGTAWWLQQLVQWPNTPQWGQQLWPPCCKLCALEEQVLQGLDGRIAVLAGRAVDVSALPATRPHTEVQGG